MTGGYLAPMRALPLAMAVVCGVHSLAQGTEKSLLWRITHPTKRDTSYLYGTIHSRDARAFRFQDSTLYCFDRCTMVAGELDMEQTRKLSPEVTDAMFLPKGSSLDKLYNKRDYKEVVAVLKMRLGPLAPMCLRLRPFYTIAMLSEMQLGNDSSLVLDAWLQDRALRAGKKVVGLETVKDQLEAIQRIPLREQAKLLFRMVRDDSTGTAMDKAMNAYAAHDLDLLMDVVGRDGMPEHADKALLMERNRTMAEKLQELMARRERVFAAIGAAHLAGERGVIERLRSMGYSVTPVGVPLNDAEP